MKRSNLDDLSDKDVANAIQEAGLLKRLDSPCIVEYVDSFIIKNAELAIVMEYCDGGDLAAQVEKRTKTRTRYTEFEIKCILFQLSLALNHCHNHGIIHRDIKTSNIFLSSTTNRLKLGDFGVSRVLSTAMSMANTQIGTPYYLSPEICKGKPYKFESDIWSLGVIMYELMNLRRPFDGSNMASLVMSITRAKFKPLHHR